MGFVVVDRILAEHENARGREKFSGIFSQVSVDNQPLGLLKPSTYMNRSGVAVEKAMSFYKLPLDGLLVITDDMALAEGRLRLRRGGSSGGHNGLASVAEYLKTQDFARLRIGIGASDLPDSADYVLSEFSKEQESAVLAGLDRAVQAVRCWFCEGIDVAMNKFNIAVDTEM